MSIEPSAVICAIINFLVLFFLLKKFLYKPVFNMLDARANEIDKNMSEAEQARDEAARLKAEYEESLKNAQTKAQEIIQNANKLGEETRAEKPFVPAKKPVKKLREKRTKPLKTCAQKWQTLQLTLQARLSAAT